ncbi:type II toxin-antitoxin system RelE/ParE family toxin [Methylobacterium komagatae]
MATITRTDQFDGWLARLRDRRAAQKVSIRIDRLAMGNPGDVAPVGEGVSEMRIHTAPATGPTIRSAVQKSCCCCAAGIRRTQVQDIETAKALAREWM